MPNILRRTPQKTSPVKTITSIPQPPEGIKKLEQHEKQPQPAFQITLDPQFVMNIGAIPSQVTLQKLPPAASGYTTVNPTKDAVATTTSLTGLLLNSKPTGVCLLLG